MTAIDDALAQLRDIVKTVSVTNGPGSRVWVHPNDSSLISKSTYPFAIVSKMNAEPGSWRAESFGAGLHIWEAVIAVYIAPGPIVVTNTDDVTVAAMTDAHEWYEAMADVLFANMNLNGTVEVIGDPDSDTLFDYITDNIMWDGQQHYGHMFLVPIYQTVLQGVSV